MRVMGEAGVVLESWEFSGSPCQGISVTLWLPLTTSTPTHAPLVGRGVEEAEEQTQKSSGCAVVRAGPG